MSESNNFESRVRGKVGDVEFQASGASWERLSGHLDQEDRKKRRGWFFLLAATLLITGGAAAWMVVNWSGSKTAGDSALASLPSEVTPVDTTVPVEEKEAVKPIVKKEEVVSEKSDVEVMTQPLSVSSINQNNPVILSSSKNEEAPVKPTETPVIGKEEINKQDQLIADPLLIKGVKLEARMHQLKQSQLSKPQISQVSNPQMTIVKDDELPTPDLTGGKLAFTVINGLQYNYRQLKTVNSSPMLEANQELRNEIEKARIDYSGGLIFRYEFKPRWTISSGVLITNMSNKVNYQRLVASDDPVRTPGDFDPDYKGGASFDYRDQGDSIAVGSGSSHINRYFWREVPVLIAYSFNSDKKVSFFAEGGISWMMLSNVNAAYVDVDNVGFYVLNDKESYPGVKNALNLNMGFGANYNFNDKISLGLLSNYKRSLTSITSSENWVKQYPYFMGLNLLFTTRF